MILNANAPDLAMRRARPTCARPFAEVRSDLTKRQWQIIKLRAAGFSNKEIGVQLSLTEGTIKVYLGRASERNGCDVRALVRNAARYDYQNRLRSFACQLNLIAEALPEEPAQKIQWITAEMTADLLQEVPHGRGIPEDH